MNIILKSVEIHKVELLDAERGTSAETLFNDLKKKHHYPDLITITTENVKYPTYSCINGKFPKYAHDYTGGYLYHNQQAVYYKAEIMTTGMKDTAKIWVQSIYNCDNILFTFKSDNIESKFTVSDLIALYRMNYEKESPEKYKDIKFYVARETYDIPWYDNLSSFIVDVKSNNSIIIQFTIKKNYKQSILDKIKGAVNL